MTKCPKITTERLNFFVRFVKKLTKSTKKRPKIMAKPMKNFDKDSQNSGCQGQISWDPPGRSLKSFLNIPQLHQAQALCGHRGAGIVCTRGPTGWSGPLPNGWHSKTPSSCKVCILPSFYLSGDGKASPNLWTVEIEELPQPLPPPLCSLDHHGK